MITDNTIWQQVISILIMGGILFLLLYGSRIYRMIKSNRVKVSKKDLVNNNQFVLQNKDRIEKILDDNQVELKNARVKVLFFLFILILSFLSFLIIKEKMICIVIVVLSSIAFGVVYYDYYKRSSEKYNEVVKNVINDYDKDLEYKPYSGFSKSEYYTCLFPEDCDRFSSEDMIINVKTSFCYSDILIESEHEDDDGNTYYVTEFQGSLARMNLKNINCRIFLGSTRKKFIFGNDKYNSIKFENDEFNKLFKACGDDELLAYKLLTPDIMEEFVNIKKNTYGDIDIRIIYDKLYIRFLSGNTFDGTVFNKTAEKRNLLQSIAVLEEVMKTMNKVKDIIDKKNMD